MSKYWYVNTKHSAFDIVCQKKDRKKTPKKQNMNLLREFEQF